MKEQVWQVYIQPGARRNEIVGKHGDRLKIKINAPASENQANEALIDFLSEKLQLPKKNIRITHGLKSRNKVVKIIGLTQDVLLFD